MSEALEPLGLRARESGVLAVVGQLGPTSQRRLSQLLEIDRSSMVQCVDRLEGLKLVARQPSPEDRRVAAVTITLRGEQTLRDAKRKLDVYEAELLAPLTKSEQATLRELLAKLAQPE